MKRVIPHHLAGLGFLVLATAACSSKGKGGGPNPIDEVLAPRFEAEGIQPVQAGDAELCRRLAADLLGRYLTADEAEQQCAGRSVGEVVSDFQRRDDYLVVSERHWRDRFDSNDLAVDWRDLKDLFGLVDTLHRGDIGYRQFAVEAMSHPGFVNNVFLPEEKVHAVFAAFMGRTPTQAEASDLAALYRPWIPSEDMDPDFPYLDRNLPVIFPVLCEPISSCTASLFGGGMLDLTGFEDPNFVGIPYETLTAAQKDALRVPGRMLTEQPFFWEAAADEILNRYLGWSDKGRFPREPGIVLPDVREVLADYLRRTGDYPGAERIVLTSWLYRMKAEVADDGLGDDPLAPVPAIYAHGPVKPALAETWLDSTAALTVDLGTCDPRYTDGFPYFLIQDAIDNGMVSDAQGTADVRRLWELQENRMPWDEEQGQPDFTYQFVARLIGGCPGFQNDRQEQTGLSYAFTQETLAELLCNVEIPGNQLTPPGTVNVENTLAHQMRIAYGRSPLAAETADYVAAQATCAGAECSENGTKNSVCVGLLGGAEMIFY